MRKKIVFLFLFSLTIIMFYQLTNESHAISIVQQLNNINGWGVVAVNSEKNHVYVSNPLSDTITILDGKTNSIMETIQVGDSPYGLGFNHVKQNLYVALESVDSVIIVNTESDKTFKQIAIEKPYDIAVNSKTDMVYVTSDNVHAVHVINGTTNSIEKSFSINDPCGIAVNENNNTIYVTSESENKVYAIDGNTNQLISAIDVQQSPRGVAVNSITNTIYVTNQLSNTVSVINGDTNTIVSTIPVEKTPRRVVVDLDTNTIFVSNHFSNSISVIDAKTNTVKQRIIANQPFELALNPNEQKIYATSALSDNMSIVNYSTQDNSLDHSPFRGLCAPGFMISENTCIPYKQCNPDIHDDTICNFKDKEQQPYLLPRQQVNAGIPGSNTVCADDLELVFRANSFGYAPACIEFDSVDPLIQREWATRIPEFLCSFEHDPQCGIDGTTYENMCMLNFEGITHAYTGQCFSEQK